MKITGFDIVAGASFLLFLFFLLSPKLEKNRLWTALVTPLASIIGSGYLVSAPLLYYAVGTKAWIAMLLIVVLAYLIGEVIRFNILYEEPILKSKIKGKFETFISELESFSNLALSFAYFVSVAFYLRLLSSFVFAGFFGKNEILEKLLTSVLLLFIGVSGFLRGLDFLEFMEKYAVGVKLSVIFSFLTVLLCYNVSNHFFFEAVTKSFNLKVLEVLAGILLIVQGFETSKYLGEKYSPSERVKSMKLAQIISGFIYVSFIFLVTPLLHLLNANKVDETAIITLAASVSVVMGILMKTGPLMSQFSASVADTIGAGGLINEETKGKISSKLSYLILSVTDVLLIWSLNIFQVITYASKTFAFYYLLQTFIGISISFKRKNYLKTLIFLLVAFSLAFVIVMGRSAE